MRLPRLLSHILDSESKSVTFGWVLSVAAHAFFSFRPEVFKVEHWVAAQGVAAGLVASKSLKEGMLEHAGIDALNQVEIKADDKPSI